ncbi:glutathione S-transferase family protein [Roseobacteraceae bacterium S113]
MRPMTYVLHYAPDNASLVIRLALETAGLPYQTMLVDRAVHQQSDAAYLALNPQGQIPVLVSPEGVAHFETAAILCHLIETHPEAELGPAPGDAARAPFMSWLFLLSNTLHPLMRMSFYPEKYIADDHHLTLRIGIKRELTRVLGLLEREAIKAQVLGAPKPNVADIYLACMLRWAQIYPAKAPTLTDLSPYPALQALLGRVEALPAVAAARQAEGLGQHPFTQPTHPNPPEGSAL